MKKIAVIVVSLITAGGITLAGIAHAYGNPEKRAERMIDKITSRLDLSEYQVTKLENLKTTVLAMREEMRDTRTEAGQTVEELLSEQQFDQQKALQFLDKPMAQVKSKMPEVIGAFAEFWNSLDVEQQAKIKEKFQDRFDHHDWHNRHSSFGAEQRSDVITL